MSEYILQSYGLTKQYGSQKAVDTISMHIQKGDIYGFIGRNGAGKTTFMKLIMGLVKPTGGDFALFGGKGAEHIEKSRRRVGAVIESPVLYPNMTAYENLEYIRTIYGLAENNCKAVLEQVGLADTGNKKAGKFSMGMKQRLGLGISLLVKPDLLLLDEPVNGLDPQGIMEVRKLLLDLNREGNMTILVSSHMLDELSRIATCYGIISEGKLVEEVSAKALREKCSGYLAVVVDNTERASYLLENNLHITQYQVHPGNLIKIHDLDVKPADINACLLQNQVMVSSLEWKGMSLEEYFIGLEKKGGTEND